MNDELAEKLKYLRLGGLLAHWDDHLKMAAKKRLSHTRLLTHIIEEEYRIKRENACKLRLKRARIPEPFVMETYPFDRQPKLNRKMILALYDSLSSCAQAATSSGSVPPAAARRGWRPAFLRMPLARGIPDAPCCSPS